MTAHTNAPTYLLPKPEAIDSLLYQMWGYVTRKDLSFRERDLANAAFRLVQQIKRG